LQLGERCRGLLLRPSGAFQLELGLPPGLRLGVPRRGGRVQHGQGFGQLRLRCLVVLVQRRELLPVLSRGGRGRLGRRGRHECAHRSVTGDCPVQQHAELEAACERVDRDAHVEQVRVGGVVAGLAHLVQRVGRDLGEHPSVFESTDPIDLSRARHTGRGAPEQLLDQHLAELPALDERPVGIAVDTGLGAGAVEGEQRLDRFEHAEVDRSPCGLQQAGIDPAHQRPASPCVLIVTVVPRGSAPVLQPRE